MSKCNTYIESEEPVYVVELHEQVCQVVEVVKTELEVVMPCHITINEAAENSGESLICELEAAETVNTNRVVGVDINGQIFHADKDSLDDALDIVGVTRQSGTIGQLVEVVKFGKLSGASLAQPGDNFWLGNDGVLLTNPPSTGDWLFIGTQLASGDILIRIGEPTTRS